jgi:hypothetical protein
MVFSKNRYSDAALDRKKIGRPRQALRNAVPHPAPRRIEEDAAGASLQRIPFILDH